MIGRIAISFLIILALGCPLDVVEVNSTGSGVVDFLLKVQGSFLKQNLLLEIFLVAGLVLVWRYIDKNKIRLKPSTVVFSALLSLFYLTGTLFEKEASLRAIYANAYQALLFVFVLAGYTMLTALILGILEDRIPKLNFCGDTGGSDICDPDDAKVNGDAKGRGKMFAFSFAVIFLCWLVWLIADFPGTMSMDALGQLSQTLVAKELSNHQPVLSTLIMTAMIKLGSAVGSRSTGIFLYGIFQGLVGAFAFSYGIAGLYAKGLKKSICAGLILFFAVVPLWGLFVLYFEKDFLYTAVLTLNFILMYEAVEAGDPSMGRLAAVFATGILSCLLRNNGIYVILPFYAVCIFVFGGKARIKQIGLTAATLAVFIVITRLVFPLAGVDEDSKREMLSIPFLQTARYVKEYPGEVTPEEAMAIDGVMDYENLAEDYDPVLADSIKDGYKGEDSLLPRYFEVWFKMLCKHPRVYVEAFLNKCYGYLAPVVEDSPPPGITPYPEAAADFRLERKSAGTAGSLLEVWRLTFFSWPVMCRLMMPGTYTWLLAFAVFILVKRRSFSTLPIFVPAVMTLLICIASPVAGAIRYALPMASMLPFCAGKTMLALSAQSCGNTAAADKE